MSQQETFDTVVRAILKQGGPSTLTEAGGVCRYRGAGGRKCAAGHLISDDGPHGYRIEMEGAAVVEETDLTDSAGSRYVFGAIRAGGHETRLVRHLQGAHDRAVSDAAPEARRLGRNLDEVFLEKFRERVVGVAATFGLDAATVRG